MQDESYLKVTCFKSRLLSVFCMWEINGRNDHGIKFFLIHDKNNKDIFYI